MSHELIVAAAAGNLAEVKRLLADPAININYAERFPNPGYDDDQRPRSPQCYRTALDVATNTEVLLCLLENNALLRVDGYYEHQSLWCAMLYNLDPIVVKKMLSVIEIINPLLRDDNHKDPERFFLNLRVSFGGYFKELFHEAIFRNEHISILDMLSLKGNIICNAESMELFLAGRKIKPEEIEFALSGIDFLESLHRMQANTARGIKKVLLKKAPPSLLLDNFPESILPLIPASCSLSQTDLIAELMYELYPEEHLIPMDVNLALAATTMQVDAPSKTKEELSAWQQPAMLRQLLNLDETDILLKVTKSQGQTGENRAIVLLAQILKFKSNELIKINEQTESLLSKEQQQKCMQVLDRYSSLSHLEKTLIKIHQQQNIAMQTLLSNQEELLARIKLQEEQQKSAADNQDALLVRIKKLEHHQPSDKWARFKKSHALVEPDEGLHQNKKARKAEDTSTDDQKISPAKPNC